MTWRPFVCALLLACRDDGDGVGTPRDGGSAGVDAGSAGAGGNCHDGTAKPPTSTVTGSGFQAWNGAAVRGCFLAAQSFTEGCDDAVVVDGGFALTAATCTGITWRVWVGDDRTCHGLGAIRPENCHCGDPYGAGGSSGFACDAGAP